MMDRELHCAQKPPTQQSNTAAVPPWETCRRNAVVVIHGWAVLAATYACLCKNVQLALSWLLGQAIECSNGCTPGYGRYMCLLYVPSCTRENA
jgi:hypothetical protein